MLETDAIRNSKIGPNIFAWVDVAGRFKIFYHGQYPDTGGLLARQLLGWPQYCFIPDQYGRLKYFQDGVMHETSVPMPGQCWAGDGFAAYLTPTGSLDVIYNGEDDIVSAGKPADLKITGNLMIYASAANYFYCWYKGKSYRLENFVPKHYLADKDILVYPDEAGRLKALYNGEQMQISNEIVNSYNLYNETITYSAETNQVKVWCKKNVFSYGN